MKKIENEILGNPDWVKVKDINVKKWYRKESNEVKNKDNNGLIPRVKASYAQIGGNDLLLSIQHWLDIIVKTGQFLELGSLENCPEDLKQKIVIVIGDDSGQGHTR